MEHIHNETYQIPQPVPEVPSEAEIAMREFNRLALGQHAMELAVDAEEDELAGS